MKEREFHDPVEQKSFLPDLSLVYAFSVTFFLASAAFSIIYGWGVLGDSDWMHIGLVFLVMACFANIETLRKKE